MRKRSPIFVTGFGPFLEYGSNPSELLARECGHDHAVLEVSYGAADAFLDSFDAKSFGILLMIGLHAGAVRPRPELLAHNWAGKTPDVEGRVWNGPILHGPGLLVGSLWNGIEIEEFDRSYHPGSYLCNYLYFVALKRFPTVRSGFLHVPPVDAMPLERQKVKLNELLKLLAGQDSQTRDAG